MTLSKIKWLPVISLLFVLTLSSCLLEGENHQLNNSSLSLASAIVGEDRRERVSDSGELTQWPYRSIVRVLMPSIGGVCSGTLVARDIVLTAAHCIFPLLEQPEDQRQVVVAANYRNGEYDDLSAVTMIDLGASDFQRHGRDNDWALLKLERPLGDTFGFMLTARSLPTGFWSRGLSAAGYSSDLESGEYLTVDRDCRIHNFLPNRGYSHDCNSWNGASGGPIFKCIEGVTGQSYCYIVAIIGGAISSLDMSEAPVHINYIGQDNTFNLAVDIDRVNQAIDRMRGL